MFFGFEKLIERRYFQRKSKVLLIHTGGTYGNLGFNYLYDLDLPYESINSLLFFLLLSVSSFSQNKTLDYIDKYKSLAIRK